jgi:hypothetical protein
VFPEHAEKPPACLPRATRSAGLPVHDAQLLAYLRLIGCVLLRNFDANLEKDGPVVWSIGHVAPCFGPFVRSHERHTVCSACSENTVCSAIHAGRQHAGTVPM